jgi:hypothetical protein
VPRRFFTGIRSAASKDILDSASFGRPIGYLRTWDETQVGANTNHTFLTTSVTAVRSGAIYVVAWQWGYDVRGGAGGCSLDIYLNGSGVQGTLVAIDGGKSVMLGATGSWAVSAGSHTVSIVVQNYNNPVTWAPHGQTLGVVFNVE